MLRRLPGIRVTALQPAKSLLPRMDVACFVGFAARGPLHQPVLIEDMQQFEEVFGGPLLLAQSQGEEHTAYLLPTLQAFFGNGGRRCWVVRVANAEEALLNQNIFPVPGLAAAVPSGDRYEFRPFYVRPASVGSWSNSLRVSSALLSRTIDVDSIDLSMGTLVIPARQAVEPGDMLRLIYADMQIYVPVAAIQSGNTSQTLSLHIDRQLICTLPTAAQLVELQNLHWMSAWQTEAQATIVSHSINGDTVSLIIEKPDVLPDPGTLVWAEVADHWLLLTVSQSENNPSDATQAIVSASGLIYTGPVPAVALGDLKRVEHLRFELLVYPDKNRQPFSLLDMAFAPDHPRYTGHLPDDQIRYSDSRSALAEETRSTGFPLAGLMRDISFLPGYTIDDPSLAELKEPLLTIPIGMGTLPLPQLSAMNTAMPIERDGLSQFTAALFLDDAMLGQTTATLIGRADDLRYRNREPRSLQGIYAALALDDVSIITVPDLLHTGWSRQADYEPPPPESSNPIPHPSWTGHTCIAPETGTDETADVPPTEPQWQNFLNANIRVIQPPTLSVDDPNPPPTGNFTLSWTTGESDGLFYLEEATRPDWSDAVLLYQGPEAARTIYGHGEGDYYYRVRVVVGQNASNWSNGVVVRIQAGDRWESISPQDADPSIWIIVQQELLRMCAASGLMFAVLGVPRHYREDKSIAHAAALQPSAPLPVGGASSASLPLNHGELRALSYGALYHPWTFIQDTAAPIPPDGMIAGIMARRAIRRGAWIAPANEILQQTIALQPSLGNSAWPHLLTARVNMLQRRPDGFLTLSSDTLHPEEQWRPINVRRLMILIRRVLVPLAESFVFEPNNRVLYRAVEREIGGLLTDLFERGAFAGGTPDASFRVRVASTAEDVDAGRFVVEIQVAPALPLEFMTIRLVQGSIQRIEEI
jgi:hypothetical protein